MSAKLQPFKLPAKAQSSLMTHDCNADLFIRRSRADNEININKLAASQPK